MHNMQRIILCLVLVLGSWASHVAAESSVGAYACGCSPATGCPATYDLTALTLRNGK